MFVRELIDVYRDQMLADAQSGRGQTAMQAVCILSQAETDMRKTPRPRVTLEAALVRLCMQEKAQDMQGVLARIERLEQKMQATTKDPETTAAVSASIPSDLLARVERLEQQANANPAASVKVEPVAPMRRQDPSPPTSVASKDFSKEPADLLPRISAALQRRNKLAGQFLSQAKQVAVREDQLIFYFTPQDDVLIAALRQHQQDVQDAVQEIMANTALTIEFSTASVQRQLEQEEADLLQRAKQAFGMDVEIED